MNALHHNTLKNASTEEKVAFLAMFNLSASAVDDVDRVCRMVLDGMDAGAKTEHQIRKYMTSKMLGLNPTDDPFEKIESNPVPTVETRGRKKNGQSAFCKAVSLIQSSPAGTTRSVILDSLISAGIPPASAPVYLWRYNKGERS